MSDLLHFCCAENEMRMQRFFCVSCHMLPQTLDTWKMCWKNDCSSLPIPITRSLKLLGALSGDRFLERRVPRPPELLLGKALC